jgi:hypothetical protein
MEALAGDHDGAKRCLLRNLRKASVECREAIAAPPVPRGGPVDGS